MIVAAAILAVLGSVAAAFGLYHLLLALAAFAYRPLPRAAVPSKRIAVLVPAHDEAELIGRCVKSLRVQDYPSDLYTVTVIADNCTDDTAALARAAGANVLVRDEPQARGKGQALRWALDRVLDAAEAPDVVAVVDADSEVDPGFLALLARPFEDGAGAAQGESLLVDDGAPASSLRAGAFLLVNRVRPAGKAVLGLGCALQGNGMAVAAAVLREHPWDAFSAAEDLEYSIALRLDGVQPHFAGGAIVRSPAAPSSDASAKQQLRWEGGKLHVAGTRAPRLVAEAFRRREWSLLEPAFDLVIPPLGLLVAADALGTIATGAAAAAGALPLWPLIPWVVGDVAVPLYVLLGFRAARAPASAYRALLRAPGLVVRKAIAVPRLLAFRADTWVRTERKARPGGET